MQGKCLKERRGRDGVRNGNFLHNQRIVDRWSNRSDPPYDSRHYEHCSCCGLEIYENPFRIDGDLFCQDCSKGMCKEWLIDGSTITCEGCDCTITDEEPYYSVGGDAYCEKCFSDFFRV
jgi:hypothetical protein